ncbi:LysR family transcriptional regulator [Mitsuaria sp. GD03876]|uniref:LysR family transcriptional regulator n=1 Tax=Mitsuaria sp. GD03876 TaxID=2975399 RepID=UPI0024498935|nr:LysR family transcriptional regulator [Mitsuaria sp. GD03876]MDH0864471.1 LysR family transcriptional regulator [Mitsuaria sp. GD03876]
MDRTLLAHLPIVLEVHRRQGFAAAANALGMSASAVSHAVQAVERALGEPLFTRTTRSVRLTDSGAAFVAALGPALDGIAEAIDHVGAQRGRVAGLLRLNVPRIALPIAITPMLRVLTSRHPDLVVEVFSDDGLADIVAAGFDAGVRLGHTVAQDMVAVRLTPPLRVALVASPAYLEAHGEPATIADLADHRCIGYRFVTSGAVYDWDLLAQGKPVAVAVPGPLRVTDSLYAKELALLGLGIAYLFEPLVREELRAGTLRQVLPRAGVEEPGLFLYFPRRAGQQAKMRALIEAAREIEAASRAPAETSAKATATGTATAKAKTRAAVRTRR